MIGQYAESLRVADPIQASAKPHLGLAVFALYTLLGFVILGPFTTVGAASMEGVTLGSVSESGSGSLMRQLGYIGVFFITLTAARVLQHPGRLLALPLSLTLALGWCWLSLLWAVNSGVSMRRVLLTTILIWSIFMLVQQIGFKKTIYAVQIALLLTLAANYAAVFASPSLGIHQTAQIGDPDLVGSWRGIMVQKNHAGALCAITILLYYFAPDKMNSAVRWGVLALAAYFLYRSGSKTSLRLTVPSLALGWLYTFYSPRYWYVAVAGLTGITVALTSSIVAYWDNLVATFSRPDALTGRGQIWPVLIAYWSDNWLLGSGYGSFWNIGPESPIYQYGTGWVVRLGQGHNGYLDMLVQIGLPGLVLAVCALFISPLLRLLTSYTIIRRDGALLIALLLFAAGHNMTESTLLDRDTIVQVFLALTAALIGVAQPPSRGS
ncbi:O-antigen ligase family protein [Microvirga aerilata]|uniref:O-antigen ligase family protein n=1 Tax=Microvirga aerilata TaxID=670292 RepID=A0A937D226_9HYPH|nr:O-antigen ligase family protein [Microvirga aerilata]MBL0407686.1 O-antigen ligase family protein [Microvirga aerilata]